MPKTKIYNDDDATFTFRMTVLNVKLLDGFLLCSSLRCEDVIHYKLVYDIIDKKVNELMVIRW